MKKEFEYTSTAFGTTPSPYRTELTVIEIDNINRNYTIEGIRYWEDVELEVNIIEQSVHYDVDDTGFVIGGSGSDNKEESFQEETEEMDNLAFKVYQDYLESIKK